MEDTAAPKLTYAARRILETAAVLFYDNGINSIGVDRIAAESGVTKKTIYDRFGSKDKLIAEYLRRRSEKWKREYVDAAIAEAPGPREAVVAVFDALQSWIGEMGDRGCAMVNARAELADDGHPSRALAEEQKRWLLRRFEGLLAEAGIPEPSEKAAELLLLHEGALVMRHLNALPEGIGTARRAAERLVAG
ncbi:TetR/AcrR family transcriptional regulator [Salininema proteolyticum]|uniref:TetR/AcrR family transcriptional regulator n=1 Tax=Salininema proteolyticum TaxID=1607685 RepID=A0ABV8U2I4_9ACTN